MRGRGFPFSSEKRASGITPAYAGKSACMQCTLQGHGDHPRVCGEECTAIASRKSLIGITPAYAGKSPAAGLHVQAYRDHPRVCGEEDAICKSCPARQGSPPRMRGRASPRLKVEPLRGITPAYAGKRFTASVTTWQNRDHPRVCGEEYSLVCCPWPASGSPPRMRGRARLFRPLCTRSRITPAYAGKRAQRAAALT